MCFFLPLQSWLWLLDRLLLLLLGWAPSFSGEESESESEEELESEEDSSEDSSTAFGRW